MCRSRGRSSRPIIATEPPAAAQCGAAKPSLAFAAPSVAGNRRLPGTDASPSRRRVASMALIQPPGWRPGGAGGARVRRRRPRRRRRRDIRQPSLAFAAPSVAGNRRLPGTDASPRPVAGRSRMPSWYPLSRCRLRFAIPAGLVGTRRLSGHGRPLLDEDSRTRALGRFTGNEIVRLRGRDTETEPGSRLLDERWRFRLHRERRELPSNVEAKYPSEETAASPAAAAYETSTGSPPGTFLLLSRA
jgi:hypothetical protein